MHRKPATVSPSCRFSFWVGPTRRYPVWHVLQVSPMAAGVLTASLCAIEFVCSRSGRPTEDQDTYYWTLFTGVQTSVGIFTVALMKAFRHPLVDKICMIINILLLHASCGLSFALLAAFPLFSFRSFLIAVTFVFTELPVITLLIIVLLSTAVSISVALSSASRALRFTVTLICTDVLSILVGTAFYFGLYLMATEGIRLYRQPRLILRDVVHLVNMEINAFRDLPLVIRKTFTVEENLYILLRITELQPLRAMVLAQLSDNSNQHQRADTLKTSNHQLRDALRSFTFGLHGDVSKHVPSSVRLSQSRYKLPDQKTAYDSLLLRNATAYSIRCLREGAQSQYTEHNSGLLLEAPLSPLLQATANIPSQPARRPTDLGCGTAHSPGYPFIDNSVVGSTISEYGSSFSSCAHRAASLWEDSTNSIAFNARTCARWIPWLCSCCICRPTVATHPLASSNKQTPVLSFSSAGTPHIPSFRLININASRSFPVSSDNAESSGAGNPPRSQGTAAVTRRGHPRIPPIGRSTHLPAYSLQVLCSPFLFLYTIQEPHSAFNRVSIVTIAKDIKPFLLNELSQLRTDPHLTGHFFRQPQFLHGLFLRGRYIIASFLAMDTIIGKMATVDQPLLIPRTTALGCFKDTRIQRWYWAWVSVPKARYCVAMHKIAVAAGLVHTGHALVAYIWMKQCTEMGSITSFTFWCIVGVRSLLELIHVFYYYWVGAGNLLQNCTFHLSYRHNRRAAFFGVSLILYAVFDTLFSLLVTNVNGREAFSSAYLALTLPPLFVRVSPRLHMITGLVCILAIFLPLPFHTECIHPFVDIVILLIMQHFLLYRPTEFYFEYLFCRYLLPYLLYLDALLPPDVRFHASDSSFNTQINERDL